VLPLSLPPPRTSPSTAPTLSTTTAQMKLEVRVPRIAPPDRDGASDFELSYSVERIDLHWTPPEAYSGGHQVASLPVL